MQSPFESAWWSFDLGEYRRCDGTYDIYAYDSLPPLDEALFTGDFTWLEPSRRATRPARDLTPLVTAAAGRGLRLPAAFLRFMSSPELRAAVPSCTACEWDASTQPVPCRVVPGAFTVRFLRDQQDCLFWYLHLLPDGTAPVLCSPIPFDAPSLEVSREVVIANTWYVAPHFEQFVYRFWIENVLWKRLNDSDPDLTPQQQAYVDHYAAAQGKRPAKVSAKKVAKKSTTGVKKAATKKSTTKESAAAGEKKSAKATAKRVVKATTSAKKSTKAGATRAGAKPAKAGATKPAKAGAKKPAQASAKSTKKPAR